MPSHYNYVFDNITNTYNFITRNNIIYRIAFVVDETFSSISGKPVPNVFQLIIEKASDELEPLDSRVSKTIAAIIDAFFQNVQNSLIYICSDEDNRAELRHSVFDRWYKASTYREFVEKIDNIFKVKTNEDEVLTFYTSFLFRKENLNYPILIEIYNQIEEVLNAEQKDE